MRIHLFLISILSTIYGLAQTSDTLSVYFEFGKHDISARQLKRIQAIPRNIYVNDLDSVYYIGMADSVGSVRANKKLGEKRAREVAKYSQKYFTTDPKIRITSMGELQHDDPARNRRVDVVFYSRAKDTIMEPLNEIEEKSVCLEKAVELLQNALIHDINYRNNEYVSVETERRRRDLSGEYYSARTVVNDSGKSTVEVYPLSWRASKTKLGLKGRTDYYTKILKKDFEEYAIFTLDSPPCGGCSFTKNGYADSFPLVNVKCKQVDDFLMNHLQSKRKGWHYYQRTVRVPKSLVNLDYEYFEGCSNRKIEWRKLSNERKWNRIKKNKWWQRFLNKVFKKRKEKQESGPYLYTDLRVLNQCMSQIVREMDCCIHGSTRSDCDKCYYIGYGGGIECLVIRGPVNPIAEIGIIKTDTQSVRYAAIGINGLFSSHRYLSNRGELFLGIAETKSLYANFKNKTTFLQIPVFDLRSYTGWTSESSVALPTRWLDVNLGLSTATYEQKNEDRIFVNSAFVELQTFVMVGKFPGSFFINAGVGNFYYLEEKTYSAITPVYSLGVHFMLPLRKYRR